MAALTATHDVQEDIARQLGISSAERIMTGFNRPNLLLEVHQACDEQGKLCALKDLLSGLNGGAIVYGGTSTVSEKPAMFAREVVGLEARAYHAGLDDGRRAKIQQAFMLGKLPAVKRIRLTAPRKDMCTHPQKKANVRGAFRAGPEFRGLRVLLLDDLFDTGATLEEIAGVLLRAGASRVGVCTLSSTIHSDK